ncbi:hypothetical protein [Streptomyces xiaopingdaonensis]|uniref:hypothetical protein n=1 Tax=Streptomyces xiaopingdaonensis TaxID=1565415 RepID=UPI0002DEDCA7|nr:hypothetical protein [Streptomyces xiaopingdaonensis]
MRRIACRNHRAATATAAVVLGAAAVPALAAPAAADGFPLRPPTSCAGGAHPVFAGPCADPAALDAEDADSAEQHGSASGEARADAAAPRLAEGADEAAEPHGELAGAPPTVVASARDLPAQCAALIGVGLVLLGVVRRLRRGRA